MNVRSPHHHSFSALRRRLPFFLSALLLLSLSSVATAADYTVTTTATTITVTDNIGNTDTLDVSEPVSGQIRFSAAGRTFSVNGGANLPGDSGALSLSGIISITVHTQGGNDTINFLGFSNTALPSLTVNGGFDNDTINFNGHYRMAAGRSLDLDLQNDGASIGTDRVAVASNVEIITSGAGSMTVKCSRSFSLGSSSLLLTENGALMVEANQQGTATADAFSGVVLNGGSLQTYGGGSIVVKGRGGNGAGGSQLGIELVNAGKISCTASGNVTVEGTGGASGGSVNRGVTVYGADSSIDTYAGTISVTGTGGPNGSAFGIGVAVLFGGTIFSDLNTVSVMGTGGGASGSNANYGIEIAESVSRIRASSGAVNVTATAGPGSSSAGLYIYNTGVINAEDDEVQIFADTMSVGASAVIIGTQVAVSGAGFFTSMDLGGADVPGLPSTLGLTDAEVDRINTPSLIFSTFNSNEFRISSEISVSSSVTLNSQQRIFPSAFGVDFSLNGSVLHLGGPLRCDITGLAVDSGYTQLKVEGLVNLNNSPLNLTSTIPGSVGNTFTVVDNDGDADLIFGTFAGLPEGTRFTWPGSSDLLAQISYTGGDGNDAVLTLISPFTVTSTADTGPGSLRDALAYAASHAGPDVITFDDGLLDGESIVLNNEIILNDATGVTIDASAVPGGVTITDGIATTYRLFSIATGSDVTLRGLTLANGGGAGFGGAIANDGTVTLEQCTLSGNSGDFGGALYNTGTMHLLRCTLSGNSALNGGGAIENTGAADLTHCTLSGNVAATFGGAIDNSGSLILTHCTVWGNTATGNWGGGATSANAFITFTNCIVAGNTASSGGEDIDINSGDLYMYGANIVQSLSWNSGGFMESPPIEADPRLAPLGNYGGPTHTMVPLPDSPALNAASGGATTDQRNFIIDDGDPDIGATEYFPFFDVSQFWEADFDGDGLKNGLEFALGTDALLPDRNNPRNLRITFFMGNPRIIFGYNLPPNLRFKWTLKRQNNLALPPEEIFYWDEESQGDLIYFHYNSLTFSQPPPEFILTDNTPNQPKAFYTLQVEVLPY